MLNRLLITWLMMTIFGYGMALAIDVHDVHSPELAHSMELAAGDHSSHADHDDAPKHDHCAHGSSHLLGLNSVLNIDFRQQHGIREYLYSDSLESPPHSRFLRPPRQA
jgi:hypothetical protein